MFMWQATTSSGCPPDQSGTNINMEYDVESTMPMIDMKAGARLETLRSCLLLEVDKLYDKSLHGMFNAKL